MNKEVDLVFLSPVRRDYRHSVLLETKGWKFKRADTEIRPYNSKKLFDIIAASKGRLKAYIRCLVVMPQ